MNWMQVVSETGKNKSIGYNLYWISSINRSLPDKLESA